MGLAASIEVRAKATDGEETLRIWNQGRRACLCVCAFVLTIVPLWGDAGADEVILRNGDRVTGKVAGIDGDKLVFDTASFGSVKIPTAVILSLKTDKAVTIEFKEGGYATGQLSSPGDGKINLTGNNATRSAFEMTAVKALHPDGKIPVPEFKWSGRINVGASQTNGNSDTRTFNLDGEAKGRGAKDRITLSAEYNRESSDGEDSADNARLAAQYDRFLTKKWFLYLQGSAERDDFADLNLRTTIGVGAGYQIIDTERTQLSVEAGPTYVNEDLQMAEDRDFVSGRWATKFEMYIFDKFAQLFHNHEGLVNLENTSDILFQTKQGIRIPFRDSFNVTAQVNWDHDTEPPPDSKKNDTKYILSVGYNW